MGYCMTLQHIDCTILDPVGALQALKNMPDKRYSWVGLKEVRACETLVGALSVWRWEAVHRGDGTVEVESFEGEKSGSDFDMFQAIAPFVKAGSCIEMLGEDGERWRWVFDGATCRELYCTTVWCRQDALDYLASTEEPCSTAK